jgi:hypothetical protein
MEKVFFKDIFFCLNYFNEQCDEIKNQIKHQLQFLFFGVHNIWNLSLKSVQQLYYNLPRWASIVFSWFRDKRQLEQQGMPTIKQRTTTTVGAAATAETLATADTTVT